METEIMSLESAERARRFKIVRTCSFLLLTACLMITFFDRFAPAAFSESLARDFGIPATALGTLAGLNLYIYTAMQVPAGALIDRFGARRCVASGILVTSAGSIVFAASPTMEVAYLGPILMGLGTSGVFVGIMKSNASWFDPSSYGVMTGITMLLANAGSVLASGPSAMLLNFFSWRAIFLVIGGISLAFSFGVYILVRDTPEVAGFTRVPQVVGAGGHRSTCRSLRFELNAIRLTRGVWPALWASIGTNSTFYALAGLWGVPLLVDGFGVGSAYASLYNTLALIAYGLASFLAGLYSDRLGRRKPIIVGACVVSVIGWTSLALFHWKPGWSGLVLYILVGTAGCQVVVVFANVKELVPSRVSATALAIVNSGVFLAAAIIETVFGVILDQYWAGQKFAGIRIYDLGDFKIALLLPAGISIFGMIMSLRCRETRCRNVAS